jgi:hypothetical protein
MKGEGLLRMCLLKIVGKKRKRRKEKKRKERERDRERKMSR